MYRLVLGLLAVTLVTATPRVRKQALSQSPGGGISPSCVQQALAPQPDVTALQACLLQGTVRACVSARACVRACTCVCVYMSESMYMSECV